MSMEQKRLSLILLIAFTERPAIKPRGTAAIYINHNIYNVPTIARAASSGLSAPVIGLPITSTDAPSSRACRGVTVRF